MPESHLFDANLLEWRPHPQLAGILIKPLASRATHPGASVLLVQVAVGGVIGLHTHEQATETAFVLTGEGMLTLGDTEIALQRGAGVTVAPGTPHSLRNTGELPMELIAIHTPPLQ
jgi:mannose-6-phosphate isomerase-like protein (cupin superfamily)